MRDFIDSVEFLLTGTALNELSEAIEAFRGCDEQTIFVALANLRGKAIRVALACNKALERVENA